MIDPERMARAVEATRAQIVAANHLWPLFNRKPTQQSDADIGECFAELAKQAGKVAAQYLFRAQWQYKEPEWYDHRLALLDPETQWNDFFTASSDNVIRCLPFNGSLLDLCSGDGWYDYWFYKDRAQIVAVERNPDAMNMALKHHAHARISYILSDIFDYEPAANAFDTVVIRGAIEHFNKEKQQRIFKMARSALKPGGYFCGDTLVRERGLPKALSAHEYEWADEAEMRQQLSQEFENVETRTLVSATRTTVLWACRV